MMDKQLLFVMFVVLLGASGDSVLQHLNITIEGKAGDRVILPCSTKDKMDISYDQVEWTFKDPTTGEDKSVHLYFQGKDYLEEQSDDFKVRTSLFIHQLSSGNCSLSLLVTTSHSGTYHSYVGGRLCCTVTLKVLPAGADDSSQIHQEVTVSPDKPNDDTDGPTRTHKVGIGVGIPAALFLLVIIILACCYRKRLMNFCRRRNANKSEIYQAVPVQAQQPPQDEEKKTLDQNPNED